MNELVSSAFKVSVARETALGMRRQSAAMRPRFWMLLATNILLVFVVAMSTVHLGVRAKQQAYLSAQLAENYAELVRQKADLQADFQSQTGVQQIRKTVADNCLGLVPRCQPGILLGPDPAREQMGALSPDQTGSTTLLSCVGNRLGAFWDKAQKALGEFSLLERTGAVE